MNNDLMQIASELISGFPYWSEIITLTASLILAIVSSKLTANSEVLKTYREKRIVVYDELIAFLDSFRQNPELALNADFYSRLLVLSNHVRVYGSRSVVSAMQTMAESLNKDYASYICAYNELLEEHTYVVCCQPDDDRAPDYMEQRYDQEALEYREGELRKRYQKTGGEAYQLVKPVLEAIRKSACSGRR